MTLIPPSPPDRLGPTPLERFLRDPWATLADLAHQWAGQATGWGLRLLVAAIPVALLVLAARLGRRWWRQRRLAAGARLVQILPPPQVEPAAAEDGLRRPLHADLALWDRRRHWAWQIG